jgi:hypothetical protein
MLMERHPAMPRTPEARYAFDYEDVQPNRGPRAFDTFGLSPEDRNALGLTAPRAGDIAPLTTSDAAAALREVLSQGAVGKTDRVKRR